MQGSPLSSNGHQKRVLVADDDPFYREMASASLSAAGYTVITACDGAEGLQFLSQMPFDVAIVDITMPNMDGYELTRRARMMHLTVPIIVVTGQDDTASVEKAFNVGATSFIAKPLNWPLFVQHVHFVHRAAQTESDLRDSKRTAEFLSELKSRVLSVLVSEFEAPLRTATSIIELIRKEPFGPLGSRTYVEYANDAHTAIGELKGLQLKMMNAGRVLSEGVALQETEMSLRDLVHDVIESVRPKADRRRLEVDIRVSIPEDIRLRCDRSLVSQALKALMESAIALSPRHSTVTIDARLDAQQGFIFAVGDSGPAMPEQMVREILSVPQPHKHDDGINTMVRNTSLTISRVLAEAHQGNLAIRSTQEEGTVARLVIPRARIAAAQQVAAAQVASKADGTDWQPQKEPARNLLGRATLARPVLQNS